MYEATQPSLGRLVALRLIGAERFVGSAELSDFDHRQRQAASVHHSSLVPFYEAGEWEGGRFVATRLVRGRTLAEMCAKGSPPAAETLEPVAEALRTAHAAGVVHGAVSAQNILIEADGTLYLADLGLRPPGSPDADIRALGTIAARLRERDGQTPRRRARRRVGLGFLGTVAAAAALFALASGGDEAQDSELVPPASPPGTVAIGSRLGPAAVQSIGCAEEPSPNTPACTLAQVRLGGRAVTVRRSGVIRAWAVREAAGDLSLQVIRERGGRSFVAGFSQPESLMDSSPRSFPAEIAVRPGDRIGLRLAPGASIGVRVATEGSELVRWDGGLTPESRALAGTELEGELMLRADIAFGARREGPEQLVGDRALSLPAGRVLAEIAVALSPRRAARVVLVELPGEIALDVVRRRRRLARIAVPDADSEGTLSELAPHCGGAGAFCLLWRNPGEEPTLSHAYRLEPSGRITLIG